jgi:leucyl-tRNA synthetase
MAAAFPFTDFEPKWQKRWEETRLFAASDPGKPGSEKNKFYILDMFPYPSGAGLHVGHPEGYTATDILARYKRMKGLNVLHPMGWDAFGLPAEQYAIQTGIHPRKATQDNIQNFKRQIKRLGFSYDWDREVDTTDSEYFKWTQWIFLQLFKRDLAYEAEVPVWWCEKLGCVLANEEVVDGKSERGGHPVEKREVRQWMLKITNFADRLLEDLEGLDWPQAIKEMQRNWIGKSFGAEVDFKVAEGQAKGETLRVFTTRPDTLFGATYMVLSPEHPLVSKVTTGKEKQSVEDYRKKAATRSELQRTQDKTKTGVFTGAYAVNPVNETKIPIWVADYVLASYGTGAIMAVPAHDQRDYEFAKAFKLPIIEVIKGGDIQKEAYGGEGECINSGQITGLKSGEGKKKITDELEKNHLGEAAVNYKLRDWLFSRQRYWGEPIPVVHCKGKCRDSSQAIKPLAEKDLPLELPDLTDFKPGTHSFSPLEKAKDWVQTKCPQCGGAAQREINTMPQWAGSCWYYLRYLDPKNKVALVSKEKEKYWMNVDLYVGGAEHAVLHLLYARFWHKVLYDLKVVSTKEPFQKLVNQGIILGEDGQKMSKSRGNVISPDKVIDQYGADSMRLYEMFMGPLEQSKAWSTKGIEGIYRFLGRVWRLFLDDTQNLRKDITPKDPDEEALRLQHELIAKVTHDLDRMCFNTSISACMVFVNQMMKREAKPKKSLETFLLLLSPFAPHLCEELWEKCGHKDSISKETWPVSDKRYLQRDQIQMVVQVNGKLRSKVQVPADIQEEELKKRVLEDKKVSEAIARKKVQRVVIVPRRLVNLVVR